MTEINIDGPTVTRDDGTERCLVVYLDGDGRVVDRAAVTHGVYSVPDAVESVKYLDSMAGFSEHLVADAYEEQY